MRPRLGTPMPWSRSCDTKGYINKLCTRTVYDESGCPHACLDEYMKSRLENKLIRAILGVN